MNEFVKKKIIAKQCIKPIILESKETKQSGIYIYERTDERGITYFYCGKAKNIYNRQIGHWNDYAQRLDKSLHTRGFYSNNNLFGWKFSILEYCPENELNEKETYYIELYLKQGKQTYNQEYGGSDGKSLTFGRKERKGYRQGQASGYTNARKDIAKLFDKNLVAEINGKPNKLKEKAMIKFIEFIGGETNDS